jgi:DNA-binding XRE family transcriptional regulator
MDSNKLKSVMALHNDTNATLADYLGITPQTFSAKLNEKKNKKGIPAEFTGSQIGKIKRKYNLSAEQVDSIFFN